jgi:hypothetical protein
MLTRFAHFLGVDTLAFRPSQSIDGPFPSVSTVCRVRG